MALVEKTNERVSAKELRSARNELTKAEKRTAELDHIIMKIYEDNATGRLTNERFDKMYADYEAEQSSLKETIARLTAQLETEQESRRNVDTASLNIRLPRKLIPISVLLVNNTTN